MEDKRPTPETFLKAALEDDNLKQPAGERWAWHANWNLSHFVLGYRAWQDGAWLEAGRKYMDYIVCQLQQGPDDYLGWIGPYIYDESQWSDVHIGDAILFNGLLAFAELVLGTPDLAATYGEDARRYVTLVEKHLFEKWDSRGTWHEDGSFGCYASWDHFLNPGDFSQWHQRQQVKNSGLSLPFNKNNAMGIAALRLFRITGQQAYLDKAVKVFSLLKSRMQPYNDSYVWNYWEPLVSRDINVEDSIARHWINVHPYRNYQAGEVSQIVEAYHTGIVFEEEDIRRLLNTNLRVMWNQSCHQPEFRNSNAHIWPGELPESHTAGTLWAALADFDPVVRELRRFGAGHRDQIERAFFQNVVLAQPPSLQRRIRGTESDVWLAPHSDSRYLHMALVLPSSIRGGEQAAIAAKTLVPGRLTVAVYDKAGKQLVSQLYDGQVDGSTDGRGSLHVLRWSGTDGEDNRLPPGDYLVRWTLEGDGYRQQPVLIS